MGALTMEIEKLNKTILESQNEIKRLQKQLEKEKNEKQNKKEYERDLKHAIENDLKNTFINCFENEGYEKGYLNLSLKSTRNDILSHVPENDMEWHWVNDNYEKVLNKVKKIYENDQKAQNTKLTAVMKELLENSDNIEIAKSIGYKPNKIYSKNDIDMLNKKIKDIKEQQEQEKKENTFFIICNVIGLIIKWFFIIVFGGIYLIFKFFVELANSMYK